MSYQEHLRSLYRRQGEERHTAVSRIGYNLEPDNVVRAEVVGDTRDVFTNEAGVQDFLEGKTLKCKHPHANLDVRVRFHSDFEANPPVVWARGRERAVDGYCTYRLGDRTYVGRCEVKFHGGRYTPRSITTSESQMNVLRRSIGVSDLGSCYWAPFMVIWGQRVVTPGRRWKQTYADGSVYAREDPDKHHMQYWVYFHDKYTSRSGRR